MPERTSYEPGTPCWIDLATTDPEAARPFYSGLFGWEIDRGVAEFGGYSTAWLNGKKVAGLVGGPMTEQPPAWTTYFATDDVAALAQHVTERGGTALMEPTAVGALGSMLVFTDPTGAFVGAWQSGEHHGAELVNEPGTVVWSELHTGDIDAALEFYTSILPLSGQDMSDGELQYKMLQLPSDRPIGGIYADAASPPAYWLTYFDVADVDAKAARVAELGGTVLQPAQDTPYGRMALVADPQGAVFSLITPPAGSTDAQA